MTTRREFLNRSAIAAAAGLVPFAGAAAQTSAEAPKISASQKPVIVTRVTGDASVEEAYAMLESGADTLDAVLHVCLGRENDPNDHTVGRGGLPNEEGVVELDSCCMHGPTRRAGSVGGVHNIKNVCLAARAVMEHTAHVMLVAEGAERFAVAQGLPREDLLTDFARKAWLLWKENHSDEDWWGPGMGSPDWKPPAPPAAPPPSGLMPKSSLRIPRIPGPEHQEIIAARAAHLYLKAEALGIAPDLRWKAVEQVLFPTTGTIHVSAVNAKGEMSGATTTSGLAWKIPGRLGDSPIIGAGCYCDQDVGSAGATGSGEENIKVAGAHTIVELMRQGRSPKEAGIETLKRIARTYNNDTTKLRYVEMEYYILRRDGAYAGVSMWNTGSTGRERVFVVHDGTRRVETCASVLSGTPIDWPPAKWR